LVTTVSNFDPPLPLQIQGQIHHRIGSLEPLQDAQHQFVQIYFMGNMEKQLDRRQTISTAVKRQILQDLQQLLHQHHALLRLFKSGLERLPSDDATILKGKFKGEEVLIPRIPMIPADMPFEFKRLQFPIRLAFAMTINKSQGQLLSICGVNLENQCFSHGQLYVACSRVGKPSVLFVLAPHNKTKNVVYPNVL